jgi:hypothetical protein
MSRAPTLRGARVVTKTLGISRDEVPVVAFVAITDPYAGQRHRYAVWAIPLGTSGAGASIVGRELDLRTARRVVQRRVALQAVQEQEGSSTLVKADAAVQGMARQGSTAFALPEAWISAPAFGGRFLVITSSRGASSRGGSVTVDWLERCARGGQVWSGSPIATSVYYTGRGWRERLVADAVTWLQAVSAKRQGESVR